MGQGVIKAQQNRPNGGMYLGSNQLNLTDNAWNVIQFGTTIKTGFIDAIEGILGGAMADAIYPNRPGFYLIIGQVWFTAVIANKAYLVRVYDNTGAAVTVESETQNDNTNDFTGRLSDVVYLQGNEALTLEARPVNVGANTVDVVGGNEYNTFLTVQRVR